MKEEFIIPRSMFLAKVDGEATSASCPSRLEEREMNYSTPQKLEGFGKYNN